MIALVKIVVAIKQVPARDSLLRVGSGGTWIDEGDLTWEINEPDAYALEAGLQLKEKNGGEVVALCAGPARAAQTIREALAKGADRAIHIEDENVDKLDTLGIGRVLARALESERPDLVLTGLQSDDLGYGQTGVVVAELLGWPHSTIIMEVEAREDGIRVKRSLDHTWDAMKDDWRSLSQIGRDGLGLACGVPGVEDHLPDKLTFTPVREVCVHCDFSRLCRSQATGEAA